MEMLSTHEYEALKLLLAKVENRHEIMALLIHVVMGKYQDNKTKAADALGYTTTSLKRIFDSYTYSDLHWAYFLFSSRMASPRPSKVLIIE